MNVVKKEASIKPTGDESDFPGTFQVVLSTPALDRDGERVLTEEWKTPLPDHITFDIDHGMSVDTTVGSGTPSIDEKGNLVVDGTYSSLPRAQEVRTLVNEGHIRTTSVAFLREKKGQKDGKATYERELLNGAFVAVPANPEAVILSSKSAEVDEPEVGVKVGARNNANDAEAIQTIHDAAAGLGASCGTKSLGFFNLEYDDGLDDVGSRIQALLTAADTSVDVALAAFAALDPATITPEIAQAINLVNAADTAIDEILATLGIPDVDEETENEDETGALAAPSTGAEKSAPVDGAKAAPVEDDLSDKVTALAIELAKAQFII